MQTFTASEVADELRCSERKVREVAASAGVGALLGGSAGWRFTEDDKHALMAAMRPVPRPAKRRRQRRVS